MADQILSPVVEEVVHSLAALVRRQFSYLFRYNGNLQEFRSQLNGLEMAGRDVKLLVEAAVRKGEVILPSVDDWLRRVDEVSVEAKRFVEEEDAVSKSCFNGPLNLIVRYQRSRKAKKKAAEFDRIKGEGQFDSVAGPAPPPQIGSMSNEHEFDFESRKLIFNEIIDAIKDNGVKMIGIWGMPGIGKTTFVKRVAKYVRDEHLFEVVAMAVVSEKQRFTVIQDQIADLIGLKFTSKSEEIRALELCRRLRELNKKLLVILDDIWDSLDLNAIGIPYGSDPEGCKIILTSRKQDVCEEMGTRKNFKINLLDADEALSLFLQKSGVDDPLSEKGRLAKKLSEECDCLPMAIVIVAGGLRNKEQFYWDDMLSRLRNFDHDRKLFDIIELSYNNLNREEEKLFFLLCALFPEDYKIPVEVLFQYGMGLDLFERVGNMDEALVRAYKLASSLKSSSLLLDEGDEEYVKMHDVIRDFALDIASKGKHAFLVTSGAQWTEWMGKTAVSLRSNDIKQFPDSLECPQLQILMLGCWYPDLQLHDNFFVGMRNLVVLDMLGMKFGRLPQSFSCLENLRTLRLSWCELGDISAIGKLKNLISLSFRDSYIQVLPKVVGELSNLRLLDLKKCYRLIAIAPGVIQNLSQLEVLYMERNFQWCDGKEGCRPENASLSELIHLSRLMILEIRIADASKLPDEVLFKNLTKFNVSIGDVHLSSVSIVLSKILKLRGLSEKVVSKAGIKMLMKRAQHLHLDDISGISVALPSDLGGYESLKELVIIGCKDVNYVLDMNESEYEPQTPSLQQLHLSGLPLLKEISRGKIPSLFVSKLKQVILYKLPSLVHLWQFPGESVALTNLTIMKVEYCEKLKYVFEQSTAKSLLMLKELVVTSCQNLQTIYLSEEEEQDDDIVFLQLSHLKLWWLENLTSFGSKFNVESTLFCKQLKVLELAHCPRLLVIFPPQSTSTLRNLEQICITNCDSLEILFQLDDVPLAVGNEMILFPRLRTLKLVKLPKLTALLRTTSQNISQATAIFPAMEVMKLRRMDNLVSIVHQQLLTSFPKLKELHLQSISHLSSNTDQLHIIKGSEALEELFINYRGGKEILQVIATLPKLKRLRLDSSHEPIEWSESLYGYKGFQSLNSLQFCFCHKSLLTSSVISCMEQLQKLFVIRCYSMESIVGEMDEKQNLDKVIEFSKLRTLCLQTLPHLTSFYTGECAMKFPCLNQFSIEDCSQLKTFASMARDMHEPSSHNFVSEAFFSQQVSLGELADLQIRNCKRLVKIFPSNLIVGLQNLTVLHVESCEALKHVFAVEDHPPILLSNLKKLYLYDLPNLKQLWWNQNTCESFGLPSLCYLTIDTCPALQFVFDPSIANRLDNLTSLYIKNCSSIIEIAPEKPGEKIVFPLLDTLHLEGLPCFTGFPAERQSVEFPKARVDTVNCLNMPKSTKFEGRSDPMKFEGSSDETELDETELEGSADEMEFEGSFDE